MKAPSQDFTVLSRGLFLFFSAFAFMGRCGAFRGLGVRLPSRDVKGVLQLTYGGERGLCARRDYSAFIFDPQLGQ